MEILSTVDAWRELARLPDDQERLAAWTESYEARFPSVFDVYYSAWGDRAKRRRAAAQSSGQVDQVLAAEERARHLLVRAEEDLRALGLLDDDELHAVLMVGGHSSNGWVAEHQGRRSVFLALEFLGMPPYDDLLVVHELAHVVQAQLSAATRARTYAASLAVMVEGAATATTRVLRPGCTESAYLWMDEDHHEWLERCEASAPAVASVLMLHADTSDEGAEVAPLLRSRGGGGVPARSGYWVGDLIARTMLEEGFGLRELLSLGREEARERVIHWARTQPGSR